MGWTGERKGVGDTVSKKGVVKIHNKEYKTVVLRVNEFREECKPTDGWGIETLIIEMTDKWACVKASITNPEGRVVGTGHGVEFWGDGNINKSSALENAETSAIGRALAAIGLGGEEYASADEVLNAIKTQETMDKAVVVEPAAVAAVGEAVVNTEPLLDARDAVTGNIQKLTDKIGEDEYRIWHSRMLTNYYKVDTIKEMKTGQLVAFAEQQQERLKQVKE